MSAKYYENPTMLSKDTAKNVGDVFLRHTVDTSHSVTPVLSSKLPPSPYVCEHSTADTTQYKEIEKLHLGCGSLRKKGESVFDLLCQILIDFNYICTLNIGNECEK